MAKALNLALREAMAELEALLGEEPAAKLALIWKLRREGGG